MPGINCIHGYDVEMETCPDCLGLAVDPKDARITEMERRVQELAESRAEIILQRNDLSKERDRLREALKDCGISGFSDMPDEKLAAIVETGKAWDKPDAQREINRRQALAGGEAE